MEDMIARGFSARHWQQIEKGRPINCTTLLRISIVFKVSVSSLVRGLPPALFVSDEPQRSMIGLKMSPSGRHS
jgi:hypothetical protein